ncbi:MAG: 16S rRNA (cytosine(1402)-N(4))-methyltransferase RsmH [Puniceicoccales bacterium]|nr:16S rRNA (cytosine(1402)-N(4))-methyltransferase RsmH [Puniceicoccales bacterium]
MDDCQNEKCKKIAKHIDKIQLESFNDGIAVYQSLELVRTRQFARGCGHWLSLCAPKIYEQSLCLDNGKELAMAPRRGGPAMAETVHIPILVRPMVEAFRLTAGRAFLDGTVGGGGHSRAILKEFPTARLWAMDVDGEAIGRTKLTLPSDRVTFAKDNFRNLDKLNQKSFDGIIFDLGVSSDQLDNFERGFSFRGDGPLDMRMNRNGGMSAAEFLETASREDIVRAIRDYGEEPHWRKVVDAIISERGSGKLLRTASFADLMHRVLPASYRMKIDSATRVFQGIRIAVNDELNALDEALSKAFSALNPGGALAVLAFHSLEDRLVKRSFRLWSGMAVDRFDGRYADQREAVGWMQSAKPLVPDAEEIRSNPRSRSAKLRIFFKFPAANVEGK